MNTVISIQLQLPAFPRVCYLVKDLETVRRFLSSAFVLRGMKWDLIPEVLDPGVVPGLLDEIRESRMPSTKAFFQEAYPFTMVPVSTYPTPRGHRIKENDLRRTDPSEKKGRTRNYYGRDTQANEAKAILLKAMETAGVKIEGKLYNSPCLACLNLFEHVAGACSLVKEAYGKVTLCHMDILSASNAVASALDGQLSNC